MTVVRVGFDYHPAVTHPPGVGRYVRELVRALVQLEDRPAIALLDVGRGARGFRPDELGFAIGDPRVERTSSDASQRLARAFDRLRRRGADDRLGGVDVFHHARPFTWNVRRARQSVAVAELPEPGSEADRALAARLLSMDLVFVFCAAYRSRLVSQHRLDPARVVQVPVGCEHWRRSLSRLEARDRPARVVVLGAIRSQRRPLAIWKAFEILLERGHDLVLDYVAPPTSPARARARSSAPDPSWTALTSAVGRSKHASRVRWNAPPPAGVTASPHDPFETERELPTRVARASLLVHLSSDEGTPVTPLEALAAGVPVVASRIPAFEEALGDAAVLVGDDEVVREPSALADAMERGLESLHDPIARARAEFVAREFTWQRCAQTTLAAWRRLG